MTDKELAKHAENYANRRVLQASGIIPEPVKAKLGRVNGVSKEDDDGFRVLKFHDLQFTGINNVKSILFQEGSVIDYSWVLKAKKDF